MKKDLNHLQHDLKEAVQVQAEREGLKDGEISLRFIPQSTLGVMYMGGRGSKCQIIFEHPINEGQVDDRASWIQIHEECEAEYEIRSRAKSNIADGSSFEPFLKVIVTVVGERKGDDAIERCALAALPALNRWVAEEIGDDGSDLAILPANTRHSMGLDIL